MTNSNRFSNRSASLFARPRKPSSPYYLKFLIDYSYADKNRTNRSYDFKQPVKPNNSFQSPLGISKIQSSLNYKYQLQNSNIHSKKTKMPKSKEIENQTDQFIKN